jgi:hypothetical protein
MSWYLSPRSIHDMRQDLCDSPTLKTSLNGLGALFPAGQDALAEAVHRDVGCPVLSADP